MTGQPGTLWDKDHDHEPHIRSQSPSVSQARRDSCSRRCRRPRAFFRPAVLAADAKPLSFQLSWIKSIQYGGYFAGIENGSFGKFGVEPTFVSGGPNIDPIGNVAAANRSSATARSALS